jgi:hypothetical protein
MNLKEIPNPHIETKKYSLHLPGSLTVPNEVRIFADHINNSPNLSNLLAIYMNNNTSNNIDWIHLKRPRSAYFSVNPNADHSKKELIIETGNIDTAGVAKLHDYLNRNINYMERINSGYHLASGHLAESNYGKLALIDQISGGVAGSEPQAILVASLIGNKILPIGGDGVPILVQ